MVHAPGRVEQTVLVLQYLVLENKISVMPGRTKGNVFGNGDNAKEKGGTNTGDKAPNFNKSDK